MRSDRGPLGPLAGVPGVTGAVVRAAVAALGQVAGLVLLAAGLAHAVARAAGQDDGALTGPLLLAAAGGTLRALAGWAGELTAARDARRAEEQQRAAQTARLAATPAPVAAAATVFGAAYPVVVPSTVDPAFDVTIADASVSDYTLTVMTWAAGIGLPVVLGYQAWTYWVFRRRLTAEPQHGEHAGAHA